MSTPAEEALAAAAAVGDPAALATIYARLAPKVRGYLRAKGALEPDDLTSEVFIQLIPQLGRLRGGWEGLRTLTFTIAHARMVDEHRRRARRPAPEPYAVDADLRTVDSAEDAALGRATDGALLAALDLLPEAERTVIVLRIVADLSIAQVAQVIGSSRSVVTRLQSRAVADLRLLVPAPADDVVGA